MKGFGSYNPIQYLGLLKQHSDIYIFFWWGGGGGIPNIDDFV